MSIFNIGNKRATKMFVSELSASPSVVEKGVVSKGIIPAMVADRIIEIAPELIEEGFKILSSTIASLAEDYRSETVVYKNIDGDNRDNIFLPPHISIVRADFPKDINKGENRYLDGYGDEVNRYKELSDIRLQIELDIIRSNDNNSFYFQPTNYYYCGKDNKREKIDEINLSFAFILAEENISDWNSIEFREIISFRDLDNEHEYNFKIDKNKYDTTYQSPWIGSELSKKGAYTIIFKIEEKRYSKSFAKIINRIYKKHENEWKTKINREIKKQLTD